MAKVTDQSFDHDYDGIKEYDNPLPRWWVWMFLLSVVWAIVYVPYYHFGPGQLPTEVYDEDMAAWLAAHPPEPLPDEAAMVAMAEDASLVATGQSVFASRCVACHAADGGGLVGPNLCDDYTIHGYSRAAIVRVVHDGGRPNKGMQPWKDQLSREEIYGVALYVHGLRGSSPAKPKPPEGEPIVDDEAATPAEGEGDEAVPSDAAPTDADAEGAGAGDEPAGADVGTEPAADANPEGTAAEGEEAPAETAAGEEAADGSGEAAAADAEAAAAAAAEPGAEPAPEGGAP